MFCPVALHGRRYSRAVSGGAAALCTPMFRLRLPLLRWLPWRILECAELRPAMRDRYVVGTGAWCLRSFTVNMLPQSDQCYRCNLSYYAEYLELQLSGSRYYWLREGILAGEEQVLVPGGEDKIVDNASHRMFCMAMVLLGHSCLNNYPITITGSHHEILF